MDAIPWLWRRRVMIITTWLVLLGSILQVQGKDISEFRTAVLEDKLDGCHSLVMERADWTKSWDMCRSVGGYLARPSEKINLMLKYGLKQHTNESVWLSLSNIATKWVYTKPSETDGDNVWEGLIMGFNDWGPGQPRHSEFNHNPCGQWKWFGKPEFKWNAAQCKEKLYFVCRTERCY